MLVFLLNMYASRGQRLAFIHSCSLASNATSTQYGRPKEKESYLRETEKQSVNSLREYSVHCSSFLKICFNTSFWKTVIIYMDLAINSSQSAFTNLCVYNSFPGHGQTPLSWSTNFTPWLSKQIWLCNIVYEATV